MEDLKLDPLSKHRQLMTSVAHEGAGQRASELAAGLGGSGLSTSCPEFWPAGLGASLSGSLPDRLDADVLFGGSRKDGFQRTNNGKGKKKAPGEMNNFFDWMKV